MTNRIENSLNSTVGSIKQSIGTTFHNPSLAASGASQKARAETNQKAADTKRHANGVGNTISGHIQKGVGAMTHNHSLEAKGHANIAKGHVQKGTV